MATKSASLAHHLDALKPAAIAPHLPTLGWVLLRWGTWALGLGIAIAAARLAAGQAIALLALGAATLMGLVVTHAWIRRLAPRRAIAVLCGVDVLAAAGLLRVTGGLDSPFLVYGLAAVAGVGWLFGAREGVLAAIAVATLGVPAALASGPYAAYGLSLLGAGAVAGWVAHHGELVAEQGVLRRQLAEQAQRLALVQEAARRGAAQFMGVLDPARLGHLAVGVARELARAERAMLLLADEVSGELRLAYDTAGGDSVPRRLGALLSGPAEWAADPHSLAAVLNARGLPATLAAPLRLRERLLGVLAVRTEAGRSPSPAEADALEVLAALASCALAGARSATERLVAHRREQLRGAELAEALLGLQQALAGLEEERELCRRIAASLAASLGAERAGVFLRAEGRDAALLAARHGPGWDAEAVQAREFSLSGEFPLAVRAMRVEKLLACGPDEPGLFLGESNQRGSAVAVPLVLGQEVLGAAFAESARPGRRWTEGEQRYLRLLAQFAALALRKLRAQRLAEHRAAQVQALLRASQAVNAELELPALLDSIVQQAAALPGVALAGLVLTEAERPRLKLYLPREGRRRELAADLDDPLFASAIAAREARIATRAEDVPRRLAELAGLSAVALQPLVLGQRVIGVLVVGRDLAAPAGPELDLRFLHHLAEQATLALSRARLSQQAETERRHAALLLQAAQLAASSLELRDRLRAIAACAASAADADRASVYQFDGRQYLTLLAAVGFDQEADRLPDTVALDVHAEAFLREVVRHKRASQVESRALRRGRLAGWPLLLPDVKRVLGVPLVAGEQVVGALFLHERRARRVFGAQEIDLLLGIARQMAAVVEQELLDEQARDSLQRERLLAEVSRELSGGERLEQRLGRVLERLAERLPLRGGSIATVEERALKVRAVFGAGEPRLPAAELSDGYQVLDWLARHERPYVGGSAHAQSVAAGGWAYLALPLVAGGELAGVLQVESERAGAFGERELSLLTAVGAQVAGALLRERLEGRLQELGVWRERALQAREIQEAAGRTLASAIIKLGAADLLAGVDREQAQGELRQARELALGTLRALRQGAATLDPAAETSIPALEGGS